MTGATRRRLTLAVLAALPLLAGCEDQEAVPTSRSTPMALLQLAAIAFVIVGGWVGLRSMNRERDATRDQPHPVRKLLVVAPIAVAGFSIFWVLAAIQAGAFGYREPTYQLFGWEETVMLAWFLIVFGGPLALLHVRMASALWGGRRWADVLLAVEASVLALCGLAAGEPISAITGITIVGTLGGLWATSKTHVVSPHAAH